MGRARLLLEAASSYRGDLEDRLTEILASALDIHSDFCRRFVQRTGIEASPAAFDVRTQQTFANQSRLVDLVIDCLDEDGAVLATVFIENKYNPNRVESPYWFSMSQWERQHAALAELPAREKRLVAVASASDQHLTIPPYDRRFTWDDIAELAESVGGGTDWRTVARLPGASASQRVLLEFVSYLKGDTVGALEHEDLVVLGRAVLAQERVEDLLDRCAEKLEPDWDDDVHDDWETPNGLPILYVALDPDQSSWLVDRDEGVGYVLIAAGAWADERAVGDPTVYAGIGWRSKRDEREALARSAWPRTVAQHGYEAISDANGNYVVKSRALLEIVNSGRTLSEQVDALVDWAGDVISTGARLPEPPGADLRPRPGSTLVRAKASRSVAKKRR